jgi:hypothetical protein
VAVRARVYAVAQAGCVTATVVQAATVAFPLAMTVWARGATAQPPVDISALVTLALILYGSTYPIGGLAKPPGVAGYLYVSGLDGVAKALHPAIYAIDTTATDLLLTAGQVALIEPAVTVRWTQT